MKNISLYITEKLKIDKDSKVEPVDLSKVRTPVISPERTDYVKMNDYRSKGSKPARLVGSIKDSNKLCRRFAVAVSLKWDEAISEFGNALVSRGIYKQEEVDKYIEVHYAKN